MIVILSIHNTWPSFLTSLLPLGWASFKMILRPSTTFMFIIRIASLIDFSSLNERNPNLFNLRVSQSLTISESITSLNQENIFTSLWSLVTQGIRPTKHWYSTRSFIISGFLKITSVTLIPYKIWKIFYVIPLEKTNWRCGLYKYNYSNLKTVYIFTRTKSRNIRLYHIPYYFVDGTRYSYVFLTNVDIQRPKIWQVMCKLQKAIY